jgi:hypothetical protein
VKWILNHYDRPFLEYICFLTYSIPKAHILSLPPHSPQVHADANVKSWKSNLDKSISYSIDTPIPSTPDGPGKRRELCAIWSVYAAPQNLSPSDTLSVVCAEIMESLLTRSSSLQVEIRVDGSAAQYTSEIERDRALFWNEQFLVYVQPSAQCSTRLNNAHQIWTWKDNLDPISVDREQDAAGWEALCMSHQHYSRRAFRCLFWR